MAERTPSNDQAAFGVFPQLQRNRSKQDREAAKNVPIDLARGAVAGVLGAPGDIESLVRMLPYLDEKTILPTSEDIEKRLPLRSETPVSKAATGLGTLAGGFYTGPGSPLRVAGALPSAIKRGAQDFALASAAGAPHVVKPTSRFPSPQMEALRLAQQRAALPIEKGGLGLPANNTPEQRAAAMGFDSDTYHGTFRDIQRLDPSSGSTESHAGRGIYSTDVPEDAGQNYASIYGPDVSGRVGRNLEERDKDFRKIHGRMRDGALTPRQQEIILQNTIGAENLGVVYPLRVRSNKSIHLDAPEANPVRIGPFEHYDEVADAYVDTPHTAKFNEALDEFRELGGEANPIYETVQDYGGPIPARDVFNVVKKTGDENGLYDPYTGDIVSGGVAAGDFMKHFGVDEIRHTPNFRNRELNIGTEHIISLDPDNVRSRFAAFDPWRKSAAIAAAMGVAAPDLLAEENKAEKKKADGGSVSISNNPDTMMLELQSKKLAEGGSVADYNTIPDMNDGGTINQGAPFKKGGKVAISKNKDAMWLATQDQKFGKGGAAAKLLSEGLDLITGGKKAATAARELTPEEKLVLEKWGQKQAQEAERAKKVEKMAKESASKSPEETAKPARASTGKRTATPPDFYRKMADELGDEAVLKAARAGKHLKPDTSGGYVGAPRTVDSPQALGKMRRDLDQDFIDSVDAVRLADPDRLGTWYDRAKSGMAQMTEPYQLPRTLEQHGVYSAGVAPESELTFALKHLNSRVYGEPKMAYRGAGMRTLDRAVAADEPAEMGFKIGEYADKNDPRLPNTGLFGVNDFRRAQGMGYTDPQGNPWKAGVSDTMHPFMDLETALQVDRANKAGTGGRSDWYGPHIQELPWVYGKAQDLYSRGASKTGRYGGDTLEGIKLALQDANKTAIDYAYKHAGSATHEAIPGASTGHVPSMIDAPLEERIAYGNVGRWDRPVPESALSEFPEVGAGNRDVIYSALGHRQLPTIEASGAYLPEGASKYEMQPVKIARPLLDFPTGGEGLIAPETKQLMDFSERFRALNDAQEAFGYNLPNTMGDVTGKNALVLDTRKLNPNRNLDPATGVQPSTEQMGALTAALEDTGYGIAPTSRGATIFPFDPSATTKDVNKLLKSKGKELEGIYPSEIEASLNSSGYGPGVGKYTPEGFTATEPFSGQATKGLLKEASYLPQSAVQNLSESEFVRQAIKEKMRRDAALPGAREDIQNTRKFFAEADWAKAVDLIRKGMTPTAALAALGYSASSMAGEADR